MFFLSNNIDLSVNVNKLLNNIKFVVLSLRIEINSSNKCYKSFGVPSTKNIKQLLFAIEIFVFLIVLINMLIILIN